LGKQDHSDLIFDFSECILLMLFSVHCLTSWLEGTVMSVGSRSSSHAHLGLQTFQNSRRPLYHIEFIIDVRVIVILIIDDQRKKIYWNFVKCVV